MECLTDIRDGHGAVINRTRGFFMSSQNTVRFSNVFLSLKTLSILWLSLLTPADQ